MRPSHLFVVDALPTSTNGKLDRRLLPVLRSFRSRSRPHVAPRTALEREVVEAAAALLGLESMGVRDDFFEAGGHSMLAAQLIQELTTRHQVELPLHELFVEPTVEHVAEVLAAALERKSVLTDSDARLAGVVEELPDTTVSELLAHLDPSGGST
jgi:hypothetical protein